MKRRTLSSIKLIGFGLEDRKIKGNLEEIYNIFSVSIKSVSVLCFCRSYFII